MYFGEHSSQLYLHPELKNAIHIGRSSIGFENGLSERQKMFFKNNHKELNKYQKEDLLNHLLL